MECSLQSKPRGLRPKIKKGKNEETAPSISYSSKGKDTQDSSQFSSRQF